MLRKTLSQASLLRATGGGNKTLLRNKQPARRTPNLHAVSALRRDARPVEPPSSRQFRPKRQALTPLPSSRPTAQLLGTAEPTAGPAGRGAGHRHRCAGRPRASRGTPPPPLCAGCCCGKEGKSGLFLESCFIVFYSNSQPCRDLLARVGF